MNRPLLKYYPALAAHIPYISLGSLPTAVEPFATDREGDEGIPGLWIKRDDRSSSIYGGNKVRKLEFVLAEAKAQGASRIATFGAIGTNHGVATSLFCSENDMDCTVYLFDQPVTATVKNNLKLMQAFGAKLEYRGSLFQTVLSYFSARAFDRGDTYYLTAGGSNIPGCVGFVNAAFELQEQVAAGLLPQPDYIFCAVGSGSTAAGLTLGCQLAGLDSTVVGVRVAPSHLGPVPICTRGTAEALMRKTSTYLRQRDATLPAITPRRIAWQDDYYGDGYGVPSEEGDAATELFAGAGITLEPTYTAKAAAAALDCCSRMPDKNVLYWHSYNSQPMAAALARADIAQLPDSLRDKL